MKTMLRGIGLLTIGTAINLIWYALAYAFMAYPASLSPIRLFVLYCPTTITAALIWSSNWPIAEAQAFILTGPLIFVLAIVQESFL
jgi:hypothetical protein